jgi:phosphatidate cytidylyltransferase
METLFETLKRLLQKRETAGVLIGAITLAVALLPLPLFGIFVVFFSYLLGFELELITRQRYLRWVSAGGALFSLMNPLSGLFFSFLAALGVGYFEVLKRFHYSKATYEGFLNAFLAGVYTGVVPATLYLIKEHSTGLLLTLIFTVWGADTLAYYVGKNFGKNPFFREISPKKTLEGFLGGLIGGTLIGLITAALLKVSVSPFTLMGAVVASVFGDLFESFIKRSYGVKDSSNLLGSHGGVLDRYDALLFASLFVASTLA